MSNYPQYGSEYGDLDAFGGQAAPKHAFSLGIETLTDGSYDCEVVAAELGKAQNNDWIVKVALRLLSAGGRQVEHTYWLNRQNSVNAFLAEMAALGFPAERWGAGQGKVPLSAAVPDCIHKLKGMRFRAQKASRHVEAQPGQFGRPAKEATTYHDLRIAGRIQGAAMPGAAPAPAPQGGGAPRPPGQPPVNGVGGGDEIPF